MTAGAFAEKKFIEIKGRRMAYIDEGTVRRSCSSMVTRRRLTCGAS